MTDALHVASTADGTGKTAIAIALGMIAQDHGLEIGYMKPKGVRLRTRAGALIDEDPTFAAALLDLEADVHTMEPIVYSTAFLRDVVRGDESIQTLRDRVIARYETLSADVDLMIVEGARRISTGGIIELTDIDVAKLLGGSVLVIGGHQHVEDLDAVLAAASGFGDQFHTLLFNDIARSHVGDLRTDIIPFLERRGISIAGAIPHRGQLAAVSVEELTAAVEAQRLTTIDPEAFVERYAVGAMSSELAFQQFRRLQNAVVITGSDRPGIQAAAIEAAGVTALLLTGVRQPPQQLIGAAQRAGTSVLMTNKDAVTTIERVESVLAAGRSGDPAMVELMRDLLVDHADPALILGLD